MAQGRNLFCIAVATACAGVSSVADLVAGRLGHHGLIVMAQGRNLFCIAVAATCAGISGVASLVAGGFGHYGFVIVAQDRDLFFVAVAALAAGVGCVAFGGAGCSNGRCLIYMLYHIDRAVRIEAALHDGIDLIGRGILHTGAHDTQDGADVAGNLSLGLCSGIVRPDTEHGAGRVGNRTAHERSIGKACCLSMITVSMVCGGSGRKGIIHTQNIVIIAMGVDHGMTLCCHILSRQRVIVAPAGSPEGDHNIGIKGVRGLTLEVDTVIESHGLHTGCLNHGVQLVDIVHKQLVLTTAHQMAKTHCTAAVLIICILVSTDVEHLAALGCEVIHILLQQGLHKGNRRAVLQVNGACRTVVAGRHAQIGHGCDEGIHMAGVIQKRDNLNARCLCMGNDFIHLGLGQLVDRGGIALLIIVCLVAVLDRRGHFRIRIAAHRHIIQQEAQAIVAEGQLQMGKTCCLHFCDQCLDPINGKVFAAVIQVQDAVIHTGGCSLRGDRCHQYHGQHHHQGQQHGADAFCHFFHFHTILRFFCSYRTSFLSCQQRCFFHIFPAANYRDYNIRQVKVNGCMAR